MATASLTAEAAEGLPKRWAIVGVLAVLVAIAVLAAKKPLLLLGVPLAIPALYAIVAWPNFYTLLVIGLLYINAPVVAVRFHGVPTIAALAIPLLLAIPIAYRWLFLRRPVSVDPVFQLGALFVAAQLVATLFSDNRSVSLGIVWETASEGLLLYLLVFNAVRSTAVLKQVVWVILFCGAAMGGLCFFQHVTKTYEQNYGGFARIEDSRGFFTTETDLQGQVRQQRLSGPIGTQNRFAQIMLMLVPLGMFRFWGEGSIRLRIAAVGATVLVMVGLMLTFSRGATVAFMIMLFVMAVLRCVTARQCLAVIVGVALLLVALPQYLTRLASLLPIVTPQPSLSAVDSSTRSRTAESLSALYMFADYPWTGVGPGMYPYHFQHYAEIVATDIPDVKVQEELRRPHDLYLELAAELGLPGLLVFLVWMTVLLVRLEHARRASLIAGRRDLALLAAGFLFAIVAYLSSALFLHFACVRYFWLMAALASSASAIVAEELSTRSAGVPRRNSATPADEVYRFQP